MIDIKIIDNDILKNCMKFIVNTCNIIMDKPIEFIFNLIVLIMGMFVVMVLMYADLDVRD